MTVTTPTIEILRAAIEGFELQKQRIDAQIAEIMRMIDSNGKVAAASPAGQEREGKMSAAGRKRIGDAQRHRWAKARSKSEAPRPVTPRTKRKLSAAGRKAIVAALKKRWADKKASLVKAETATSKKPVGSKGDSKKAAK